MLSRDDLLDHAYSPGHPDDLPLMEICEPHAHQVRHLTCGQRIAMHCGDKQYFSSALLFWRWSFQRFEGPSASDRVFRHAAQDAVCEAISNRAYYDIADYYFGLFKRSPPDFLLRQDLLWAEKIFCGVTAGDSRMSILAEFEEVFVAIHSRIAL